MKGRSCGNTTSLVMRGWILPFVLGGMLVACGSRGRSKGPDGKDQVPVPTPSGTSSNDCPSAPKRSELEAVAKKLPVSSGSAEPSALALLAFAGKVPLSCVK